MTLCLRPRALPMCALLLLAATACHAPAPDGEHGDPDVVAEDVPEAPAINATAVKEHVRYLASDELEGRAPGTHGEELARAYLQLQFEKYGLQPAGDNGGWLQKVPFLGVTTTVEQTLTATSATGVLTFAAPDDYTAVGGSDYPTSGWKDAEVVFVGYGITAPEQRWDDFKGIDMSGKVLLVMNNDPEDDPALFAGKTRLYYGRWSYKYEEAARRGAIGAIVIHTTPSAGYPYQVAQANHGRENFWLPFRKGERVLPIRSWMSEDAAKKLCRAGGKDLDELRKAAETRAFLPVPLGVKVSLAISNKGRKFDSNNVLGLLPGSDPQLAAEQVIVTAHFDHLGRGKPRGDDAIYNGALDNASGVAGMLTIAQACAQMAQRPKRSILFAAVTGEESGLLGSEWLATHLPCDKKLAVANYNIDGLNIWGATKDVEFIGYGKSSLTELASALAQAEGRRVEPDSEPDKGLFYRSDHFNFARQGIPAAYFKAGRDFVERAEDRRRMKASYTATHYHQPSDELADWWNFDGAVADLQLLLRCLVATATGPAPTWTPGDEFAKLR